MEAGKEPKYTEWKDAEQMHSECVNWLLQLEFIKNEHRFIMDLIDKFFSDLGEMNHYRESSSEINELNENRLEVEALIEKMKKHNNELVILVDDEDQLEAEKAVRKDHQVLAENVEMAMRNFGDHKRKFFSILTNIMREQKHLFLIRKQ